MRSGNAGLAGYTVSLYQNFVDRADSWEFVGASTSDANGDFQMFYDIPSERCVLIVQAEPWAGHACERDRLRPGPACKSRSQRTYHRRDGQRVRTVRRGPTRGRQLRRHDQRREHGRQLAHPSTAIRRRRVAHAKRRQTSTFATFNSLANTVTAASRGQRFSTYSRRPGRQAAPPRHVLQAVANIVKYPSYPGYPNGQRIPYFSCPTQPRSISLPSANGRPTGSCSSNSPAASTVRRTAAIS